MPTADQKAIAATYRDAAVQHATVARELYDLSRFAESNYIAGLSVECMLRGYRVMSDPEFDSRHDLQQLYRLARFGDVIPPNDAIRVTAALDQVIALWANDHRFLDDAALRKRWARRRLYEGVKGDFLKERVRQLVNASGTIVSIGAVRWTTYFKN
jgi:hypothetical protein